MRPVLVRASSGPLHRRRTLGLAAGVVALAFTGASVHAVSAQASADPASRIINGSVVAEGQNPGAVFAAGCSASLIAPEWVMTAKHCILKGIRPSWVSYGSVDQRKQKKVTVLDFKNFDGGDISLIRVAPAITDMPPVKIADATPATGTEITTYGWGMTAEFGPQSPLLKAARMKVDEMGVDSYKGPALVATAVDGVGWKGDSGGPAFAGGVQVGVLSQGSPPEKRNWFASVANARAWIKATTGI